MYIHRYGDGPRYYLGIHGWAADHTTFALLAEHMPKDCSIFAVDLPGYGKSPALTQWDWPSLNDAFTTALEQLDGHPFELIGSCSGAIIGLGTLHERAAAINLTRMTLLEPFAFVPSYLGVFLTPALGKLAYWSTFANPLGRKITDLATSSKQATDDQTTQSSFAKVDPWVPYQYLAMMDALKSATRFAHLELPTHLIHGDKTFKAVKDSIHIWQTMWPHATSDTLEDLGHMLVQEDPRHVAKLIFDHTP